MELEKLGHTVIHETATDIIINEQDLGVDHPWQEPAFIDKIIHMQKARQLDAAGNLQFYDRSPFCTYALGKYLKFSPSNTLLAEIHRCFKGRVYQNKVYFFENLGFIKQNDARKISFEEALIFEKIHLDVYKEFGFDIMMVPSGLAVTQRCKFILQNSNT